jgi:hypothetical protein
MRFFSVHSILALVLISILPSPLPAQSGSGPMTVRRDVHHDMSPPLREMMRHARPVAHGKLEAEPARQIPLPPGFKPLAEDPVRQLSADGYSPQVGLTFEGVGDGQYGFTVEYAPPDTNGAVGATQYVQWVNTYFAVFAKSNGSLIAGPVAANTLWTGFGGGCESDNDGDPIVTYDKLANRWVMSQFAIFTNPYLQCVAVSVTSDATGSWYRYSFQYSYLDDYPKMGVWPDAYYETFNMFNGDDFVGADACAYNRSAMLNGQPATQICFQQTSGVGSLLPSDLDGATLPPARSPNYMMDYGANSLNLYQFHVDFNNPSNSTFTGPTVISVAAFTPLCGGGRDCVPQPLTTNQLDSLADRLMHRLAYRNFGSHESLVVNHTVAVNGSSGIRWYEIQSPGNNPVVAQQGTYAPDSSYRWMGSIAMDKVGDLAVGYSISSSSVYPSIAFAGRVPSDPTGQLELETSVMVGSGSQTPNLTRWGDYSAMTLDPVDDCTFWYTQEYILSTGAFNWNTRIVNFQFPGCTSGGYIGFYPDDVNFGDQTVGTTSPPQIIAFSNHTTSTLTISSIVVAGDFAQNNNCGTSLAPNTSCNINVTFQPTTSGVRGGTLTVTDNGPGSPRVADLSGIGILVPSCVAGILSNGGFETGGLDCWTSGGALSPTTSTLQAHSGAFSALLGSIGLPVPNGDSWIYQTISVPTNVQSPTLSFWYWPWTESSVQYEWQEAQIRDVNGNELAQIFKTASNAQQWTYVSFDLTPYQGQTIQLYFNVYENGGSVPTYMYLDDVAVAAAPITQRFIAVPPCRVVDTRNPDGTFGGPAIGGGSTRNFPLPQGGCSIPSSATAYALNVTVVPHGSLNYLTIWPTGATQPVVSTLNSYDGRVKANAAVVPAGSSGAVSVYVTNTSDVILDITGYFTTGNNSALAFFPLTPCRVADTRGATGPLGGPMLQQNQQRDFPVLSSACSIPSAAAAYSMNFTVVPKNGGPLGYLTVWPTGQTQPVVSTLNAPTGTVTANAAIVPAGTNGDIETYAYGNDTNLIIDINGYFAAPGSGSNPMSLYSLTPCRVLDTRQPPPQQPFSGEIRVAVANSPCGVPGSATSYVLNATVIPAGPLGYLTLWPDGQPQPVVSTLNALDGAVTSNMAIVPTTNQYIDAYAPDPTYLILDISAYFAP